MDRLNSLADSFRKFATTRYFENRLYANLSLKIAGDNKILKFIVDSTTKNPVPHLFFAAVHFLLLNLEQKNDSKESLYVLYKIFSNTGVVNRDIYRIFRNFCIKNQLNIQALISTRYVQTNHIQRCTSLLPALNYVYNSKKNNSLSIVELGTSAGFNLLFDKVNYIYKHNDLEFNIKKSESSINLECNCLGDFLPPIPKQFPKIDFKLGIDIHPIDLDCNEDILWLTALIWPGPNFQMSLNNLKCAIKLAKQNKIPILEGNILEIFPDLLYSLLRKFDNLCIFNFYVLYQLSSEERNFLEKMFYNFSKIKNFSWISLEKINSDTQYPCLEITEYSNGSSLKKKLAYCHDQGLWIQWRSSTSNTDLLRKN